MAQNPSVWEQELTPKQMEDIVRGYNGELDRFSRSAGQYGLGHFSAEKLKIELS